jgi:hypothetical protein
MIGSLSAYPSWAAMFEAADGSIDPIFLKSLRLAPASETPAQKAANWALWPKTDIYSTPSADPDCITDWSVFNALNAQNPACALYYSPNPGRPCDTAMDCPPIKKNQPATAAPITAADTAALDTSTGTLTYASGAQVQYLAPPVNPAPPMPNTVAAPPVAGGPSGLPLPGVSPTAWLSEPSIVSPSIPNWELLGGAAVLVLFLMMRRHR